MWTQGVFLQADETGAPLRKRGSSKGGENVFAARFVREKGKIMSSDKQSLFDALGRASVIGLHMVSGIIVGCLVGYGADKWLGSAPWGAGIGLIVGIAAGFRNVWRDARILLRQGEEADANKKHSDGSGRP